MPIVLKITGSNTTTGDLEINNSHSSHHRVYNDVDNVRWEIEGNIIDSIALITIKSGSENIWKTQPYPINAARKIWRGQIDLNAKEGDACIYSITWYKGGHQYLFDPIISIKPSHNILLPVLIPAILGFIMLVQTFRLKNFRRKAGV